MKRAIAILCALGVIVAVTRAFVTNVSPQYGTPTRWNLNEARLDFYTHPNVVNPQTRAIRYFLGSDTYSEANRTAELQALRNCFLQWQAVPGTVLKFEEGGILPGKLDIDTEDNTNVVFWTKGSTLVNNEKESISGFTGLTYLAVLADNRIVEADTVLNGVEYRWFTDYNNPAPGAFFVESVALHEIGHFVGLDHSPLGAAAMYARSSEGSKLQSELSDDDLTAARYLYGLAATTNALGRLAGKITMNSTGILGASVILEDLAGNAISGTVTATNGTYELPAIKPGSYHARIVPLDPPFIGGNSSLTAGWNIEYRFTSAETSFLPTTNKPITILASQITTLNVAVTPGSPAFRITRLGAPTASPPFVGINAADSLALGQNNVWVGVFSPNLPQSNATFTLTGDGLTLGAPVFQANVFAGLNLISMLVSVAPNATPGMRTLIVQQGTDVAYANGFLKILSAFPDINRDGLDDRFQRQYFVTPFATNAAPALDPDRDGYNNSAENIAGSNPLDASSVLRIESIRWDVTGATIRWRSAASKRYRVSGRVSGASADVWQTLAELVVASGDTTEFADPAGTVSSRLYRVEAIP